MPSNSAIITPVIAAGAVDPYFVQVNISQRLCHSCCVTQPPVFTPVFSVVGFSPVGTNQYVATIHVEGVISYVPCGAGPCCSKSQVLSQDFTVPFFSVAVPTSVTIAAGVPVNTIAVAACQTCSRSFVSETPLTLTIA